MAEASGLAVSFRVDPVRLIYPHCPEQQTLPDGRDSWQRPQQAAPPRAGQQKQRTDPDVHLLLARANRVARPSLRRAGPCPQRGCARGTSHEEEEFWVNNAITAEVQTQGWIYANFPAGLRRDPARLQVI